MVFMKHLITITSLLLVPTCLTKAPVFGQNVQVKGFSEAERIKLAESTFRSLFGAELDYQGSTRSASTTIYDGRYGTIVFHNNSKMPFLGEFHRRSDRNAQLPIVKQPIDIERGITRYSKLLKIDLTGMKRKKSVNQAADLDTVSAVFNDVIDGIETDGSGRYFALQLRKSTGELLGFTCRRNAVKIGGVPLKKQQLAKIASSFDQSLDVTGGKFLWVSPAKFAKTKKLKNLDNSAVILTFYAKNKKEMKFFKADSGDYLGSDSLY
jgi:hypothetical protein